MSTDELAPSGVNVLNLTVVSCKRFAFAVRAISQNDLWDEVLEELENRGCHSVALSLEPIEVMQDILRQRPAYASRRHMERDGDRRGEYDRRREDRPREQFSDPQEEFSGMSRPERHLDRFLSSACGNPPHYPPRPPDDWPEGPWDHPQ
ncbi:hypothetical protein ACZ90_21710 [Streptomyces albus subsp. albus]|nr:hypothetical protein ACZ90_21710 [Streptomyces albus subsp. albus]